ncbi:MAG: outer membrane protein assembly factor BamD [Planctomycetes bacterium]|nr:outer membrane protein assembly factor BamD [Planctomycetota bacterium]
MPQPSSRRTPLALAALTLVVAACQSAYPYDAKTPDEIQADARADIERRDASSALTKLEYIRTKHPDYPDQEGVDFKHAVAKKIQGRLWKAFVEFREFLEKYRASSYVHESAQHIYDIGTQLIQSRSSFLGTGIFREADDGVLVLTYFAEQFPNHPSLDAALRLMAGYKFETGDYPGAIADYDRIVKAHLESPWHDFAEYRIAICHLRSVRRADLDQSELRKAYEALQSYLTFRTSGMRREEVMAALRECTEKLSESEYRIGDFYRVLGKHFGAAQHFRLAATQYPGTYWAVKAEEALAALPPESGALTEAPRTVAPGSASRPAADAAGTAPW